MPKKPRKPTHQPSLQLSLAEKVNDFRAYLKTLPDPSSWYPYHEREFMERCFKFLSTPDTVPTKTARRQVRPPKLASDFVAILNLFQEEVPFAFEMPAPPDPDKIYYLPDDFENPKETPLTTAIRRYQSRYWRKNVELSEWMKRFRRCKDPRCRQWFLDCSPRWMTYPARFCSDRHRARTFKARRKASHASS